MASKQAYKLVLQVKDTKLILNFNNFTLATNRLVKHGSGRLYQGSKLVGEL